MKNRTRDFFKRIGSLATMTLPWPVTLNGPEYRRFPR
jgi:hypothetical protein